MVMKKDFNILEVYCLFVDESWSIKSSQAQEREHTLHSYVGSYAMYRAE